ncbi:hypothetical protein DH86_00003929, partial [Scytalidium sp. 3C]
TLPILFPSDHLNFWRDYLCQQAWEAEYTYEAIIALGSLHRAVLLMSRSSKNDQDRGLDIKVIAFQRYTQSLQELSNKFQDPKEPMALLIGTASHEISLPPYDIFVLLTITSGRRLQIVYNKLDHFGYQSMLHCEIYHWFAASQYHFQT